MGPRHGGTLSWHIQFNKTPIQYNAPTPTHRLQYTDSNTYSEAEAEFALLLIRPNCLLASVDLQDAYFTIPIALEHQKFLRFLWRNKLWQFYQAHHAYLRNIGHISANYMDDSLLIGDTVNECIKNVQARCALMTNSVLSSHILIYTQSLNTLDMTVRLQTNKMPVVVNACRHLANHTNPSILLVAQVIGRLVSCFPAMPLGLLFYI